MQFTKMHGLGNDYIFVNREKEQIQDPSALAIDMSRPHIGVGADGLILIGPSDQGDFSMEMYNADGSMGEMCGNGIRCVGKYIYDKGLSRSSQLRIETISGVKQLYLTISNNQVKKITVDMGIPELRPEKIPVSTPGELALEMPLDIGEALYPVTCVSMGNPHAVVFLDEIDALDLERLGPLFEHHRLFPQRINTEFIRVKSKNALEMRVWERGSGETKACGTGACASVVAGVLTGRCERNVSVHLPGGILRVVWETDSGHVMLTGPAATVFEGEWLAK